MPHNIKALREARGISQSELARLIGAVPSTISRMEDGKRRLTTEYMTAIARALACDPADLISDNGGHADLSLHQIKIDSPLSLDRWSVERDESSATTEVLPVLPSGKHVSLAHAAHLIEDDHALALARKGSYVITVPFSAIRKQVIKDEWIVVRMKEGRMVNHVAGVGKITPSGQKVVVDGNEIALGGDILPVGVVTAVYWQL